MFKSISKFINSHPIGQLFKLEGKDVAWKKVAELKAGQKIAIAPLPNLSDFNGKVPAEIEFDEIISIRKVGRQRVWDIEVEGTHNFVGNGIVAHNTTSIAMRAGSATLEASNLGTSSTTADIQLYAADSMLASVGDLTLQASEDSTYPIILRSAQGGIQLSTQSSDNGNLTLYSAGTLTLDTSRNNTNIILSPGTGNVGIGTTGPLETLQVAGTVSLNGELRFRDSVTHYLRSMTNNDMGVMLYNGSTDVVVATFQPSGNLGIASTSPAGILDIGTSAAGILLRAGQPGITISSSSAGNTADIQLAAPDRIDLFAGSLSLQTSSTTAGELKLMSKGSLILDTSGGTGDLIMTKLNTLGYVCTTAGGVVTAGGASCASSDVRLKTDIRSISEDMNVLESLEKLRGVSFTWDQTNPVNAGAPAGRQVGMIAQEVEQVLPSLVNIGADGYRRLDYAKMTGYLVEVAKELNLKIDQLGAAKGSDPFVNGGGSDPAFTLDGSNGTYEAHVSNVQGAADLDSLTTRVTQLEDLVALLAGSSTLETSNSDFRFQISDLTLSGSYMDSEANLGDGLVSLQPTAGLTLNTSNQSYTTYETYLAAADGGLQILGSATVGGTLTVGLITIDDLEGSIYGMGCAKGSSDPSCTALKIQPLALGNVEFLGGKIVMTKAGDVEISGDLTVAGNVSVAGDATFQGDVVVGGTVAGSKIEILEDQNSLNSPNSPTAASIGEAVVPAGQTRLTVYSTAVTANSKVFVTADRPAAIGAETDGAGRFIIRLAEPTPSPLTVSWWIVN